MFLLQVVLWTAFGLIVYAYAGFPLLLAVRSCLRRRPWITRDVTPRVSLIVIAHNEQASIGAKLENLLALDYPADRVQVLVGSDGSDDDTHEIVSSYADRGVQLCVFPRRGKIPALNTTVERADGEILVFSDANSMFLPDALRQLVRPFADPAVGAVAGNQRYGFDHGNAASFGERLYWGFDRWLKQMQSTAGNVTSATGAIHAVRRDRFRPVPAGVCDDFVISTRVIAQGDRLVFAPKAIACEAVAPSDAAEFRRKARVIARGLRGLWEVRELLDPWRYGFYSLQLFTHKLLRWSVIWLMLIVLVSSTSLVGTAPPYNLLLAAQVLFYGLALAGYLVTILRPRSRCDSPRTSQASTWFWDRPLLRKTRLAKGWAFKLLALPLYFCLVNLAALCGWLQWLSGRRLDVWTTTRSADGDRRKGTCPCRAAPSPWKGRPLMCGICGKVYFDPQRPVEPDVIEEMCYQLRARGPNDRGRYLHGSVGLGSTRLSIIDVAGGHMPLANEDGSVWIAFNGEIYNFAQLRQHLEGLGHQFATRTDTEVMVHLYEEEGEDFCRLLNGMFAVAIWDERNRRLVLARDHLGIKPLYYCHLDDRLLFGSEIKALLADGIDREIDPVALHDYLSLNYVPGPRSMLAGIRKLLPGQMLVLDADSGTTQLRNFWDVPRPECRNTVRSGDLEDQLLDLLRQVVRDQMVSDVPLGAFLSGGLDSSLVVALMSEVAPGAVRTFSVGFRERSYDESPFARVVAERFQTDHHELILDPDARATVESMADYFDEPFADSSAVAVHAVSQLASQQVKVVLSGDGGDEVFGGYATYQADRWASLYRRLPHTLGARLIPRLVELIPVSDRKVSWEFKLKRFVQGASLPPLSAHVAWKAFFSEEMKSRLYAAEYTAGSLGLRPTVNVMREYFDRYHSSDLLNRLLYVDTKVQMVDDMLTKVDRMSMAHSLEVRVPLLDLRLVEFMARLPSDQKVRGCQLKYLLKRIARRLLPPQILDRSKAGFHVPIPRWLKTDLREMVGDYLAPGVVARQGLFDPAVVTSLLNAHWSGRQDHSRNLWNLLMFSLWHERYLQAPVPARLQSMAG